MDKIVTKKKTALEAFKVALERKRMVEEYMRQGKRLTELEEKGIKFWRVPAIG